MFGMQQKVHGRSLPFLKQITPVTNTFALVTVKGIAHARSSWKVCLPSLNWSRWELAPVFAYLLLLVLCHFSAAFFCREVPPTSPVCYFGWQRVGVRRLWKGTVTDPAARERFSVWKWRRHLVLRSGTSSGIARTDKRDLELNYWNSLKESHCFKWDSIYSPRSAGKVCVCVSGFVPHMTIYGHVYVTWSGDHAKHRWRDCKRSKYFVAHRQE